LVQSIKCRRVSHPNVIVEDYDASVAQFRDLFGAEFLLDLPKPEWHACLIEIGGVILELFAPPLFLLHSRHGPQYLGMEYEADIDEVRASLKDHDVRIIRELGVAVHTDPRDCLGVDFEFYNDTFFDPDKSVLSQPLKPAAYWRDEHPLGLMGLKAYTLAVSDIDVASAFLQSFISGEPVYEASRTALNAKAVGLQVADCVVELLSPLGKGPMQRQLEQIGQGIHSLVFRVRDLEQARRYFAGKGIETTEGTAPDRIALALSASRGLLFEFSE
jgi:catechol 2,3-dioxygenase-like lactoylglutathione lyase family enzyme